MNVCGSGFLFYSNATAADEALLLNQLDWLGFTQIVKFENRADLEKLGPFNKFSALLLLITDADCNERSVLALLNLPETLPVIGFFSDRCSSIGQPIIDKCKVVATWPCSKRELDFRLGRLFSDGCEIESLDQRLFVKMNILGNSPSFMRVLDKVYKLNKCDAPVYISGETGTGKEMIARAIHYLSGRQERPFIATNCGAVPDQLIENELFGHSKGAYTDASEDREGIVAQAEGGTLFLDEIEALSAKGQVVLLRFLETKMYRPLGAKSDKSADVRIITATNESIAKLIKKGDFREDLFFRINIMNVQLPPLRERREDISMLAEHFIRLYQIQYDEPDRELHSNTKVALKYYDWPGNVRELENVLHREFLMAEGRYITIDEVEASIGERRERCCDRRLQEMFDKPMIEVKKYMIKSFEQQYLVSALRRAKGNISEAARMAGKERRAFTRLLDKYRLDSNLYKTQ